MSWGEINPKKLVKQQRRAARRGFPTPGLAQTQSSVGTTMAGPRPGTPAVPPRSTLAAPANVKAGPPTRPRASRSVAAPSGGAMVGIPVSPRRLLSLSRRTLLDRSTRGSPAMTHAELAKGYRKVK